MSLPDGLTPAQLLYPDMDQEFASTRRMLSIVPDGSNDWKPHEKSMSLGQLATHLSGLSSFVTTILATDELDFAKTPWKEDEFNDTAARLARFDKESAEMKRNVEAADWDLLAQTWTMRAGETVYIAEKKSTLVRTFGFSHMAHHRAQLGVFLRLKGIVIPGPYGPSADEM